MLISIHASHGKPFLVVGSAIIGDFYTFSKRENVRHSSSVHSGAGNNID